MESNLIKKRIQLNHNLSISDSLLQAKEPISKSKRKFSSLFISLLSIIALAIIATILVVPSIKLNNTPITHSTRKATEEENSQREIEYYNSDMISLTQNNFIEYSKDLEYVDRNIQTEIKYEEVNEQISYGGDNTALDEKYEEILAENNKLIASSTTYDEIGSDGKLYLNGEYIGRDLYKHIFSVGLYGGGVSDEEKAIKKVMKINPVSTTNYITGLYAPPGEVIKVEISDEDLANIGG